MKKLLEKYDPFCDLEKYERLLLCYNLHDLEMEAESNPLEENLKKLNEIKMILLMTSRLFLLTSASFGYCSLPIIYHFVFGWSIPLLKFLTISGIIFPIYFYLIYDRLAVHPKNIQLREFLKQYRLVLIKVIAAQKQTKNVPTW
ncbi:MAG: hypothetical protein NTU44_15325 [Bacteroidetes bacterium]|nr:hypothetical protein [Bacteroidota bacterium]